MIRAWALGLLIAFQPLPARAEEAPDVAWRQDVTLKLTRDPAGKFALKGFTQVSQTYLTARAAKVNRFTVVEQYYATISEMKAWCRGKEIGRGAFGFEYPQHRDVFMSSAKLHHIDFPEDLKAGDQVTYSYEEAFRDLAYTPFYRIYDRGCVEGFALTIDHPADIAVRFDSFLPHGAAPTISHPSPTRTVLVLGRLPRLERHPGYEWNGCHALIYPRFSLAGQDLLPSTPERFAAWYQGLLGPTPESTGLLLETAQKVAGKAVTPREKVKALYGFVKEQIRYAADERDLGAIVPRPPAEVLTRGYGDCKDKARLLQALGAACGVSLDMVLLDTDGVPGVPALHVGNFNHVIARFEEGGHATYMDPTHPHVEFGNLPESDIGKEGLVLGNHPARVVIPAPEQAPSLEIRVKAGLEDLRRGEAEVILRNDYLAMAREALRELRPLEVENRLSNTINARLAKLSLDDFRLVEERETEAHFKATANLESFLTASSTRRYLPQAPFRALDPELADRKADTLPIHLDTAPWIRLDLQFTGEGWKSKPDHWRSTTQGPFLAQATADERLHFAFEVRQGVRVAEGPERTAFLDFLTELLQRRKNLFTLERSAP